MKLFGLIDICFDKDKKGGGGLRFNLGSLKYRLDGRGSFSFYGMGTGLRVTQNPHPWKKARGNLVLQPDREPNPHIVISGMSGFGKSTLFKSMLMDMHDCGLSCIIFDAHDEHSALVASMGGIVHESASSGINILSLDGSSVSERISEITSLLGKVYGLGYIQTTKLSGCLWYTYKRFGALSANDRILAREPRIGDLLYEIGVFIKNSKSAGERNSLLHLRDRISRLNSPSFSANRFSASDLSNGMHSFSLSSIKGSEQQVIYIEELLRRLYSVMKSTRKDGGVRQYIMMDEAQFLISRSSSSSEIVTSFIEEGRKYGIGVIIVAHSSVNLNRQIVANASTFISFYSREPSEVAFASKVMAQDHNAEYAIRGRLSKLNKNEALVISANDRTPKVVSTAMLYGRPHGRPAAAPPILQIGLPVKISAPPEKLVADPKGTIEMPNLGKVEGYRYENNGVKEFWLMRKTRSVSTEHEVMVSKLSEALKSESISCVVHNKSNGPDLIACANGLKIAIEYETGRKNIEHTRAMVESRARLYDRTVVVVNDLYVDAYRDQIPGCEIVSANDLCRVAEIIKSTAYSR